MQALVKALEFDNNYGMIMFSPKNQDLKFSTSPGRFKKVVVMDSSYNPPTRAHVQLCLNAISQKVRDIDALVMLLATKNADKHRSTVDDHLKRFELIKTVALNELSLSGGAETLVAATSASLFRDKAQLLNQEFGPDCQLYFILGYDTVIRLFDMKYYPESRSIHEALDPLFANGVHLLVAARSHDSQLMQKFIQENITLDLKCRSLVHLIEMPSDFIDISSTKARQYIQDGKYEELKQLVPDSIYQKLKSANQKS